MIRKKKLNEDAKKYFHFHKKKRQVLEHSNLNVICGRTIGTISKQLNKLNVKFISEMEKIK